MHALGLQFGGLQYKGAVLAKVARSKRRKNAKPLLKKRQITSKNAKQAETSQMLLVLTFPND